MDMDMDPMDMDPMDMDPMAAEVNSYFLHMYI